MKGMDISLLDDVLKYSNTFQGIHIIRLEILMGAQLYYYQDVGRKHGRNLKTEK